MKVKIKMSRKLNKKEFINKFTSKFSFEDLVNQQYQDYIDMDERIINEDYLKNDVILKDYKK